MSRVIGYSPSINTPPVVGSFLTFYYDGKAANCRFLKDQSGKLTVESFDSGEFNQFEDHSISRRFFEERYMQLLFNLVKEHNQIAYHLDVPGIEKINIPEGQFKTHHEALGTEIGRLVGNEYRAYEDTFGRTGDVMRILYPEGIRGDQMDDALAAAQVLENLFLIATDRDVSGKPPWRDVAGYALLGHARQLKKNEPPF
jgi:hypothetical protein